MSEDMAGDLGKSMAGRLDFMDNVFFGWIPAWFFGITLIWLSCPDELSGEKDDTSKIFADGYLRLWPCLQRYDGRNRKPLCVIPANRINRKKVSIMIEEVDKNSYIYRLLPICYADDTFCSFFNYLVKKNQVNSI